MIKVNSLPTPDNIGFRLPDSFSRRRRDGKDMVIEGDFSHRRMVGEEIDIGVRGGHGG